VLKTQFSIPIDIAKLTYIIKNIPAYYAKGDFMTKMQIIAKAVLTLLGLSALTNFCINLTMLPQLFLINNQSISVLRVVPSLLLAIIFTIAVVYILMFKNNWLACKMAGSGEKLDSESETLWLTASLRIIAILYGLILFSSSIINLFAQLFFINETFTSGTCPKPLAFTVSQWSSTVYNFLQTILAAYLLYGWPHFIRYQLSLRKPELSLDKKLNIEGIKNE
jgi:ABC-type phosphate/phosphonate transport system permease subunit